MKTFLTLPGYLRYFFHALRILGVAFGVLWIFVVIFGPWVGSRFTDHPRLMITVGDATLAGGAWPAERNAAGPVGINALHGTLQMDLMGGDPALVAAMRRVMVPVGLLFIAFAWFFFGSLYKLCACLARGEVFSEKTLGFMRQAGLSLIVYGFVGPVTAVWAMHTINGYLQLPLAVATLQGASLVHFSLPRGIISYPEALVAGGLVLVLSEAFRQGLKLKAENDLTI